jgi:dynein heavy chain
MPCTSLADVSKALEKVVLEKGLQLHATWLNKCIQLYETYLVRHGRSQGSQLLRQW